MVIGNGSQDNYREEMVLENNIMISLSFFKNEEKAGILLSGKPDFLLKCYLKTHYDVNHL